MASKVKIACEGMGIDGPYSVEVEGETFGAWAAHDDVCGNGFKVTFLRFGLAIPFEFQSMRAACNAAEEINAMKGDWDNVTHAGIKSIGKRIGQIATLHGGERYFSGAVFKGEPTPVEELQN